MRDKLQEDAKKDNLVQEVEVYTNDPIAQTAQEGPTGSRKQGAATGAVTKQMKAKEYRGDLQKNFDEILSAVGDYFELFKNNTNKLEALWLQLLEYLNVKNSNQCRIFRRMHYSIYIDTVIRNRTIDAIVKEVHHWKGTKDESKNLADYL